MTKFATEIGVSKQTVSAYLNVVRKPKSIVSGEIARKLNINPARLLGFDVSKEPSNEKNISQIGGVLTTDEKMLDTYRHFNDEGKEKALERLLEMSELDKYKN